jgi:DNA-binding MarR family transcriptional regulator
VAQEIWRPLVREIEARWMERFGAAEVTALRELLQEIVEELDLDLPYYLPVLGHGMVARVSFGEMVAAEGRGGETAAGLPFYALVSQVLLAFTLEFEREAEVSLALSANVVRILDESGVRRRDLPRLSSISREAVSMSLSFLEKRGYVTVEPDPRGGRTALVRLTQTGREAQATYHRLAAEIEERWCVRFGNDVIDDLRRSLERLVGEPGAASSRLFTGLRPYRDGWRAHHPMPETLPHYPMVLHRGGYPDGS